MSKNTVIYLRVSGDSQIGGDGFPRQREACEKYAAANGLSIVKEFRDEGITGKMELEGRNGLSSCIAYVREHGIDNMLCESSDRLARDMIVAEVIVREFQKIGVRIVAASSGIDLTAGDDSNPTAKLIRQILAAVAEFDRCCINLKLRGARDRKREATGKCEGQKAYGDKEGEYDTLHMMRSLRAAGMSCDGIAEALNIKGIPARKRGVKNYSGLWLGCTVNKILKREAL